MKRAVAIVVLILLLPGSAFGREDRDGPITVGVYEALGTVWPERWTLRARWVSDTDALVAAPVVRESDRIGVQPLISCARRGRWTCEVSDPELHVEANGVRHRTRARNVERDDVVKIVDYVYSQCFNAQQEALGWKPYRSPSPYRPGIYDIADLGNGRFEVATGGALNGSMYRLEADSDADSGCAFQLRSRRVWLIRP